MLNESKKNLKIIKTEITRSVQIVCCVLAAHRRQSCSIAFDQKSLISLFGEKDSASFRLKKREKVAFLWKASGRRGRIMTSEKRLVKR